MTAQSALIIGATGATGKRVLAELLASPSFNRVGEYGRRVTPLEQITAGKEKLEQKTIDFEKLGEAGLASGNWDVVFITLGTSKAAAGSAEAFEKIDREYVINSARAAKSTGDSHKQRLVYVSAQAANPSSSLLYPRSKGMTELGLAGLGYADTIILRPCFLTAAERPKSRPVETVFGVLTGLASHITDSAEIKVSVLAKAMRLAGQLGSSTLPAVPGVTKEGNDTPFTAIANKGAVALAKTEA